MKGHFFCAAAFLVFCQNASGGPGDYVASTYDNDHQIELDFKFGSVSQSQTRASEASLGLGYGVTRQWFSELYVAYARDGSDAFHSDAFSWLNAFLLTHGQYPVDIGIYTEIERPADHSEGYELKVGPLLQTDFGKTQVNGNLFFSRHLASDNGGETELSYQWQAKYRLQPKFQLGLQGFGELGQWDHWAPRSEQSHRIGPAIFGTFNVGENQAWSYDAAYLIDASDAQHSNTFRTRIQFVF